MDWSLIGVKTYGHYQSPDPNQLSSIDAAWHGCVSIVWNGKGLLKVPDLPLGSEFVAC